MRRRLALVAIVILAAACSSSSDGSSSPTTVPATTTTSSSTTTTTTVAATTTTTAPAATVPAGPTAFRDLGPYPVGVRVVTVDGLALTIWYPGLPGAEAGRARATYDMRTLLPDDERPKVDGVDVSTFTMDAYADLPAAPTTTPYPLVLFSHGLGGFATQSSFLTTAIASWGFVVVAPEHQSRDLTAILTNQLGQGGSDDADLDAALPIIEGLHIAENGPLSGLIDTSRIAVVGHSAGGGAAYRFAARRPDVATYVALASPASAGSDPSGPAVPALFVAGSNDAIAALPAVEAAWDQLTGTPKRLAVLDGVSHLGFMDVCTLAADRGGVLQVARDYGVNVPDIVVRLFADGCAPTNTPAVDAWPIIRHLVVAQLRAAFGIDPAPVGLDPSVNGAYPVAVSWRQVP